MAAQRWLECGTPAAQAVQSAKLWVLTLVCWYPAALRHRLLGVNVVGIDDYALHCGVGGQGGGQ